MNVDRYIGIPDTELGPLPCWELVRRIYRCELGIVLPAHDTIDVEDGDAIRKAIDGDTSSPMWWQVDKGQEIPFDVLTMRGMYKDRDTGRMKWGEVHCGMALGGGYLIHVEPEGQSAALPYAHPTITPGRIKRIWRHRSQVG